MENKLKFNFVKKHSRLISVLLILLTCVVLYFVLFVRSINHRGKYDETFSFNIKASYSDIGPMDGLWEREIYLVKNDIDSIEIKLPPSKSIGFGLCKDTILINGVPCDIFVFGNLDGSNELAVVLSNLKIVDKNYSQTKIFPRLKFDKENTYPKSYLKNNFKW